MGIFQSGLKLVQSFKYGKQVGNISKSGLACYAKTGKGGLTTYTTVDKLSGDVVRTKKIWRQNDEYTRACVWDGKGNVTAHYETLRQPVGYGMGSHNQFACETRNISERYNKFGQVTDKRDITFRPGTNELGANITYDINGNATTRYLFTDTNELSPAFNGYINFLN